MDLSELNTAEVAILGSTITSIVSMVSVLVSSRTTLKVAERTHEYTVQREANKHAAATAVEVKRQKLEKLEELVELTLQLFDALGEARVNVKEDIQEWGETGKHTRYDHFRKPTLLMGKVYILQSLYLPELADLVGALDKLNGEIQRYIHSEWDGIHTMEQAKAWRSAEVGSTYMSRTNEKISAIQGVTIHLLQKGREIVTSE